MILNQHRKHCNVQKLFNDVQSNYSVSSEALLYKNVKNLGRF